VADLVLRVSSLIQLLNKFPYNNEVITITRVTFEIEGYENEVVIDICCSFAMRRN